MEKVECCTILQVHDLYICIYIYLYIYVNMYIYIY